MSNAVAPVLKPGDLVAETYEVERLIGRGGMGEVWLASHRRLPGKRVAIKILHTTSAAGLSDEAMKRFKREAEIASRIGHPNIVEVHDFNFLPSGAPYLVLEYLVGESLAARLRHGPLPLEQAKTIVYQVGSALAATHAHGVVHRDLKPDNIFLIASPVGERVKVLDFGISKIQDSQTVQTMESALVGTPQYMAPEQALGQNKDISGQTDVFALAAITYEMLSGQPAFTGDNLAKLVFNVAYQPHTPIAQVCPGLPACERDAIEHGLTKDRAQRTPTIQAFVEAFTQQTLTLSEPVPRPDTALGGIATPGVAPSESMMLGQTAAPTPMAQKATGAVSVSSVAPAPAAVTEPKKSSALPFVAVGVVALLGAGGYLAWAPSPHAQPAQAVVPVTTLQKIVPAPAPFDAGAAAVAKVIDAGEPVVAPFPVRPFKAERGVTPEDNVRLQPADDALKNEKWNEAARRAMQALPDLTPAGQVRAQSVAAKAYCAQQDLQNVLTRCRNVTNSRMQTDVENFCRGKGMKVVCRP